MKYITVKLTEDQANHVLWLLNQDMAWLEACSNKEATIKPIAFNKRLLTTLAKAKS